MKACVFISSSSEQLAIARALEANLDAEGFEPNLWSRGAHGASEYNLEALLEAANSSDFGAFIFAPDDQVTIHGETFGAVRDNVLFELGLFIGKLGRDRCYVLRERSSSMRMPSDLDGLIVLEYKRGRSDGDLKKTLGPVSTDIANRARVTATSAASVFSGNDIKLLRVSKATSFPSNQAFKAFGEKPGRWDDKLCMRFLRLFERGLLETTGPTEVCSTRRGKLLAESKRAR